MSKEKQFLLLIIGVPIFFILISWYINFELVCKFKWYEYIFGIVFIWSGTTILTIPIFITYFWKPEE